MAKLIEKTKDIKDRILATKNIKIELKELSPKTKFSIKSSSFAGGDSIDVRWADGPTNEEVNKIIQKYQEGEFDPMSDCYNYHNGDKREFNKKYGGVMFIFSKRKYSVKFLRLAAKQIKLEEQLIELIDKMADTQILDFGYSFKSIIDFKEE